MSPFRHIDPQHLAVSANATAELAALFLRVGAQQWESVARAWQERSAPRLAHEVHKLRGSLAIVGAQEALSMATAIESACLAGELPAREEDFTSLRDAFGNVIREVAVLAESGARAS